MSKCTYCPVRQGCPGVEIDFSFMQKSLDAIAEESGIDSVKPGMQPSQSVSDRK